MMKNRLSGLLFLSACLAAGFVQAEGKSSPVPDVAAAGVRAHSAKTDAMHQSGIDFHCELGNKLTVYEHEGEKDRIGLRWNKQMHDLTRVQTTTGANRFENKQSGLVWISIPGKSMLLDSQKGRQLANECRTTEQLKGMKSKT